MPGRNRYSFNIFGPGSKCLPLKGIARKTTCAESETRTFAEKSPSRASVVKKTNTANARILEIADIDRFLLGSIFPVSWQVSGDAVTPAEQSEGFA